MKKLYNKQINRLDIQKYYIIVLMKNVKIQSIIYIVFHNIINQNVKVKKYNV